MFTDGDPALDTTDAKEMLVALVSGQESIIQRLERLETQQKQMMMMQEQLIRQQVCTARAAAAAAGARGGRAGAAA